MSCFSDCMFVDASVKSLLKICSELLDSILMSAVSEVDGCSRDRSFVVSCVLYGLMFDVIFVDI